MNFGKNPNKANNTSSNGYNKAAAPMQFDGAAIKNGIVNPKGLSTWKMNGASTKSDASVKSVVSSAQPVANPARSGDGKINGKNWDG